MMKVFDLLVMAYVKLNKKLLFNTNKHYHTRKEQDEFLERFNESDDYYKNSFNKYKCICYYHYNMVSRALYNFCAMFLLLPLYIYFNRRHLQMCSKNDKLLVVRKRQLIRINDIFPSELKSKYHVEEFDVNINKIYLDSDANKVLWESVKLHPFSFYYLFVVMERLAIQSTIIHIKNPSMICNYVCEREFADPILTYYSSKYNIKYDGFMHGDYRFEVDHAFMKYDCYWVWDEHYIMMFKNLKCNQTMKIYTPQKYMPMDIKVRDENECPYYFTYYLSGEENEESLDKIKNIFDIFRDLGKECKIRPHPVHSNYEHISLLFGDYFVEDVRYYSLEKSVEDTFFVVALNSTVLSQAYRSGKTIVIDDVSDKDTYKELLEKDYISYKQARYLLSGFLGIR